MTKRNLISATALVIAALAFTQLSAGQDAVDWTPVYDGISFATWSVEEPLQAIYAARSKALP